ncbi:hypothetical protein KKG57_03155 [Patescibacteria group bacterium]|nr:hypothetical protein [Patescibacteria group bacterium]
MEEITIDDKIYVSSKRAAKITGYAKDYVGQLCREGRVVAKLVGRSWYVLEESIREHRFGAEKTVEEPVSVVSEEKTDVLHTWKTPQYAAMEPVKVPDFVAKENPRPEANTAVSDMQAAWKEWFADKNQTAQKALPDGKEDFRDEYLPVEIEEEPQIPSNNDAEEEEVVMISRIKDEETVQEVAQEAEEEVVQIHKTYEPTQTQQSFVRQNTEAQAAKREVNDDKAGNTSRGSHLARAILTILALVFVMVSVIGTGYADSLLSGTSIKTGPQEAIIDYLGGTRSIDKQ